MNRILLLWLFTLIACDTSSSSMDEENVAIISPSDYDISVILSKFDNIDAVSYAVSGNSVTFTTTDLPNHTSPYWPSSNALYEPYSGTNPDWNQNPGSIGEQNISFTISLYPEEAESKSSTPLGPIGIARNGVVFFNQYAGPDNEPLTGEINTFDQWLGHPARTEYHYHVEPTFLTKTFGSDAFLGLLSDGFPVYGPLENGVIITNEDLDEYHGHISATEDFPDGIYHYHITDEDPYINGSAYYGTPGNISR